jgi:hypothetical protein
MFMSISYLHVECQVVDGLSFRIHAIGGKK